MALRAVNLDVRNINPHHAKMLKSNKKIKLMKGGRKSGKSWYVPQHIIMLYMSEEGKGRNAILYRKHQRKARDSVYMAFRRCLSLWGLLNTVVKCNQTRMEFTFPNGNVVRCRGLNDPDGAKSSEFENGTLTDVWVEEADQIDLDAFLTLLITVRGSQGVKTNVFLTFNKISKRSWIYKEFYTQKRSDVYYSYSTYMDNIFLSDEDRAEADEMKVFNPARYESEYLAKWADLGELIYDDIVVEDVPKDDNWYDSIFYGLDFGFVDPMAWVKVGLKDGEFYIIDEIYQNRIDTEELARLLELHGMPKGKDLESDHDKERQLTLIKNGYRSVNADKTGKKSDRIKLIRGRKIHINVDCENFIEEVSFYKYKKTRDGEITEEPEDGNDHLMDAFSYAVIKFIKRMELGSANKIGAKKLRSQATTKKVKTGARNSRGRKKR